MHKIDIDTWKGRKHYLWFKNYPVHYYSVTKTIDITNVYHYSKENKRSFFITLLYLVTKALNQVEELRLRVINDEVYVFDLIHPAYTVMTEIGVFDNCENDFLHDFDSFYALTSSAIAKAKEGLKEEVSYNDLSRHDQFYITCVPWIDFTSMTHPMPNDTTQFIPRIAWGKYHEEHGRYLISLNIHVSHALVDGYPLAQAFIKIQEAIDQFNK